MKLFKIILLIIAATVVLSCNNTKESHDHSNLKLWYNKPADATIKEDPYDWHSDQEWLMPRAFLLAQVRCRAMLRLKAIIEHLH
jgi:hypothetical protein